VRARVERAASARGLQADVGGVSLGWLAVSLSDVRVRQRDSPALDGRAAQVRIELTGALVPERIDVRGVEVHLVGTRAELETAARGWRGQAGPTEGRGGRAPKVSVDGLGASWVERDGEAPLLDVKGARAARGDDGWHVSVEHVGARSGRLQVDATDSTVHVTPSGEVAEGRASLVTLALERRAEEPIEPGDGETSEPPPLPLGNAKLVATDPGAVRRLRLPLPELHGVHAALVAIGALARERLAPGARLHVDAMRFVLGGGQPSFAVGQGPLTLERTDASLQVAFSTRANAQAAQGAPLALTASVPLEAGVPCHARRGRGNGDSRRGRQGYPERPRPTRACGDGRNAHVRR
jgi:hypothetical protein